MPKAKSLSSHISRRKLTPHETVDGLREMRLGTDRAAAIVGAAFVEDALIRGIRAHLMNEDRIGQLFFEQGSPFGTLHNKIVVAYALDLIDEAMVNDLQIIKSVRNQFAHALMALDFANEHISRECLKIREYEPKLPTVRKNPQSRLRYEDACVGIWEAITDTTNQHLADINENLRRKRDEIVQFLEENAPATPRSPA